MGLCSQNKQPWITTIERSSWTCCPQRQAANGMVSQREDRYLPQLIKHQKCSRRQNFGFTCRAPDVSADMLDFSRQYHTTVTCPKGHKADFNATHTKKRLFQKLYYDATSRPLTPLSEGQVIMLQTTKGHSHLGTVKDVCKEPRSYIIESDGGTYRRNRRHILPVAEPPPPSQRMDPADFNSQPPDLVTPATPLSALQPQQTPQPTVTPARRSSELWIPAACSTAKIMNSDTPYVTRSGQICKPNPKHSALKKIKTKVCAILLEILNEQFCVDYERNLKYFICKIVVFEKYKFVHTERSVLKWLTPTA